MPSVNRSNILTTDVNITSLPEVIQTISQWIDEKSSHTVCVANVHVCMEAFDNKAYCELVNNADLIIPDGKPLAVGLKLSGFKEAQQIRGADITLELCRQANQHGWIIGLYGSTEKVLSDFEHFILVNYPNIKIACIISPPFRELTAEEDQQFIDQINAAGVQILFVGLGCPKQEQWMSTHKGRVNAVMLGVGAVFDFLSGNKKEAPWWIQAIGLEWLFRLCCEPKRLWQRYLKHNPRFLWYFAKQLLQKNNSST
jgi:N-acetylglucosaminyldiphosphoundecaprenol N-acetyl-beta-D-mannosaminyltransferase